MKWTYPAGSTPLDPSETAGLKLKGLTLQGELNIEEAMNIAEAAFWLDGNVSKRPLDEAFLSTLHREMFGRVWRWAGSYRISNKNLGVDWLQIRESMTIHLGNVQQQLESSTLLEQVASFYHHGLVFIHPFPNGNGRWARMATEVLCEELGLNQPSWTRIKSDYAQYRDHYITALKAADAGDHDPLQKLLFTGGSI